MAASVSGSKVVTVNISPSHTAAILTTLYATPVEQLTKANLMFLEHCCQSKIGGQENTFILGNLTT